MRLTKRNIDAIKANGEDHFVWDTQLPGFGLRVSPQGRKTYVVQYRFKGRTQRVSIGRASIITLDEARRNAKVILGKIESGNNPAMDVRVYRKAPTLSEINVRFIKEHIELRLKPSTQVNYKQIMKAYVLPALGDRKVSEITHKDVVELHTALGYTPYQANRALLVLSKIFNLCEKWGLRDHGSNPCRHVEKYKEKNRNRFLDRSELERLWDTLDEELETGPTSQYAIGAYKLLILTGCRLGEIQKMQWSHVKGNRVEFPDTKTGYKRLPFNADAMHVLHSIPRQLGNDFVICGDKPGTHIVNLQKSWRRIRVKAKLDDVRIHDLRHTFASHAVMNGTPLAIVSKLLGHSKIGTTMRYAHLADKELAEASEGIGRMLLNKGAANLSHISKTKANAR